MTSGCDSPISAGKRQDDQENHAAEDAYFGNGVRAGSVPGPVAVLSNGP